MPPTTVPDPRQRYVHNLRIILGLVSGFVLLPLAILFIGSPSYQLAAGAIKPGIVISTDATRNTALVDTGEDQITVKVSCSTRGADTCEVGENQQIEFVRSADSKNNVSFKSLQISYMIGIIPVFLIGLNIFLMIKPPQIRRTASIGPFKVV